MVRLVQIPMLRDNFGYVVVHEARAFVVDPPEADAVLAFLRRHAGVTLEAVVNTHHHADHVGGNRALVARTGCDVIGPAHDAGRIPGLTRAVAIDEVVEVAGLPLRVLDVRAHTRGHIAYVCDAPMDEVIRHGHGGQPRPIDRLAGRPVAFVGDSLFAAGCGRLFEGSPRDLVLALERLASLPPSTLVCCAHEYTASNLRFARHVLPDHAALRDRESQLEAERAEAGSTVPDTLERELETNPFLLVLETAARHRIAARLGVADHDVVAVMGALRRAKDRF